MIELPIWVAILIVIAAGVWAVKILRTGRVEGFRFALNTLITVADLYAKEDNRILEPHEHDMAACIDVVLPDLIEGYTKQQAKRVEQTADPRAGK